MRERVLRFFKDYDIALKPEKETWKKDNTNHPSIR